MEEEKKKRIFILYILDNNIFLKIRDGKYFTDSSIIGEGPRFDNSARCKLNYCDLKVDKFLRVNTIDNIFGYIALLDKSEGNRDSFKRYISYEIIPISIFGKLLDQYKILEDEKEILDILNKYKEGNYEEISLKRSKEPWEY